MSLKEKCHREQLELEKSKLQQEWQLLNALATECARTHEDQLRWKVNLEETGAKRHQELMQLYGVLLNSTKFLESSGCLVGCVMPVPKS